MERAGRPWCLAPTSALHLDTNGDVQVCCAGRSYPLGNVATSSLHQIWTGERAQALRDAVARHDLSVGCQVCQWEVSTGGQAAIARTFDRFEGRADDWPATMTFALSNTCNLRCVMCTGDHSSAIRAQVEHRAPLPVAYDDRFFDDLVAFLPHLVEAEFVGGEPFLSRPTLRAMDLLVRHGNDPAVHINTNGTVWNDQVQQLITGLRANVSVSIDAITSPTFESIRRGASLADVMENLGRIRATCDAVDRFTGITLSLMVHNWQELPAMVIWTTRAGFRLDLTKVVDPPEHSLYQLPLDELTDIVAELRAHEPEVLAALGSLPEPWTGTIAQLDARTRSHEIAFPTRRRPSS